MNRQEILTQSNYQMPTINVVWDNQSYGFMQHAQIVSKFDYGVRLYNTYWAATARGMGADAFTATNLAELDAAMAAIMDLQNSGSKKPILLDAKIYYADPMDTSHIVLDPDKYSPEEIKQYKEAYRVFDLPSLSEILKKM